MERVGPCPLTRAIMGKINLPQPTVATKAESNVVDNAQIDAKGLSEKAVEMIRTDLNLTENEKFDDDTVEMIPIKRFFDIDPMNQEYDEQMKYVVDYVKSSGARSRADVLAEIKAIEYKLGNSYSPQRRIEKLYTYIKLTKQAREALRGAIQLEKRSNEYK